VPIFQPGAIDLHAHFLPPRYRDAALAHGPNPDGPPYPEWDPAAAVAMMDEVGIAAQALSLSSPGVAFLDDPAGRARLVRAVNEDGAAAVAAWLFARAELPAARRPVAVLSGGNVDPALLARVIGGSGPGAGTPEPARH